MNSKWLLGGAVVILILGAAAFLLLNRGSSNPTSEPSPTLSQTEPTSQTTTSPTQEAKEVKITLSSSGFSPKTVTIDAGTKVVWVNNSGTTATVNSDPHPSHTAYPPLNLNSFDDKESLELVFNDPGTYGYHNHFDSSERGTIIVK